MSKPIKLISSPSTREEYEELKKNYGDRFREDVRKLAQPESRKEALESLSRMKGWVWSHDDVDEGKPDPQITAAFDRAVDALADPRTPENEKADHLMFLQFLAGGPEKRAEILKSLDKAQGAGA